MEININDSLMKCVEIKLSDKLVLTYINSIYKTTGTFYMSDKKLSENLGCSIKQIRTSIKKLSEFDWFIVDTRANVTASGYGGKTRFIRINENKLTI